jgi:uncharacterized protein (TIGR03437 family)
LLADAGYRVEIVSPENLGAALRSPDLLAAVPSLERLPLDAFKAIAAHTDAGGGLMASGGEPFRVPLYLAPSGEWMDRSTWERAFGSPPQGSFVLPFIPTVSPPAREQYTTNAGLHVPIVRGRGLFSTSFTTGRSRVIGDLLGPAATVYAGADVFGGAGSSAVVVWLPWPQLFSPLREQLVAVLAGLRSRVSLQSAGADQLVWLPGESITGKVTIVNAGTDPVQANLQWSVGGISGSGERPAIALALTPGEFRQIPIEIGRLPYGNYTLRFRLTIGDREVDRADSPVRVLDPLASRQPNEKIRVADGKFVAGGRHVFLRGVNYWPRYIPGVVPGAFNGQSWLQSGQYDPDMVEADLTQIEALGFNLVNIQFSDYVGLWAQEGRSLIDFLERCRNHHLWAQISLRTTVLNGAYEGQISPTLDSFLQAAYLPGNDRVFAYDLLWEPMVGSHDAAGQGRLVNGQVVYNTGRLVLDADWRAWVDLQYGSTAEAERMWGLSAPRDAQGRLTNPLDSQIENDGPWRVMVAAYRRFLEDYMGRNLGAIARQIRRTDPDTLLTYRNWVTMTPFHNRETGYDIGTGVAHLDFVSPERYGPAVTWPDNRASGLVTAYSRYRSGGKPVVWAEYGSDIGANGGSAAARAAQTATCEAMMRLVGEDGSNGASVWWWPGGYEPMDGSDFGIVDPDGAPRGCAKVLARWNESFAREAPDVQSGPATTIVVDRDADARGSYGVHLNNGDRYVQERQGGRAVELKDEGTASDTSTMPLLQVGNTPYSGAGPLKFVNGEFAEFRVTCPGVDVTAENGATVTVPAGAVCQVSPTVVNTGAAAWLPSAESTRGVVLRTSGGDALLTAPLASLQRANIGPLSVTASSGAIVLRGRLSVSGAGDFGEALNLTLTTVSSTSCPVSLDSSGTIAARAPATNGTINVAAASGCGWTARSGVPWLTIATGTGSGAGAVSYAISANYGPARRGAIEIGGRTITVTQDAAVAAQPAGYATLSATSLTFGKQTLGSPASQPVEVTNSGPVPLRLSITAGGLNVAEFTETDDCGSSIAPGGSCTIAVTFTPAAAGTRTATLFVNGNLAGGALTAGLSGAGADARPSPVVQGIVDSWGYTAGVAPGLWVTIAGTNLVAGPAEVWNLDGARELPRTLGGARVTFNGAPAVLLYASDAQINALVPARVASGPVEVVVEVDGAASLPFRVMARGAQPAVYAPASADGSAFFVTAALAGTGTLVGNRDTDPRVSRGAYPGETVDLYMIGLGATVDAAAFVTDQVFSGAFPVAVDVNATVGGAPARVLFAGLTAPGLYLVRLLVPPDAPTGSQALRVSVGGIETRSSLFLQVAAPN